MLSKDQITKCVDVKITSVPVPEWGGDVGIRVMSGRSRLAVETFIAGNPENYLGLVEMLLSLTLCDESGTLLFTQSDMTELGDRNWDVLQRLYGVALEANAVRSKDIDSLGKDSPPIPSDCSVSSLPEPSEKP